MRGPLHTFFLVLIICLVQFFTVATLKILDAGGSGGGTPGPSSGGLDDCVAGDINNDAAVNIADAIYVLSYLFTSGPEPVACAGNPTEVVVTGSADVNVINIPDVAVSGTADVNVINTPTVNLAGPAEVTVSNTPTVNVGNIADVSIAGTASVEVANIPEVIVTNTADMNIVNVPTVSVAELQGAQSVTITGALQPSNAVQIATGIISETNSNSVFVVPAGQTLFITDVSTVVPSEQTYAASVYLGTVTQPERIGFSLGGTGSNYGGGAPSSIHFNSPITFQSGEEIVLNFNSLNCSTCTRKFWLGGFLTSN